MRNFRAQTKLSLNRATMMFRAQDETTCPQKNIKVSVGKSRRLHASCCLRGFGRPYDEGDNSGGYGYPGGRNPIPNPAKLEPYGDGNS